MSSKQKQSIFVTKKRTILMTSILKGVTLILYNDILMYSARFYTEGLLGGVYK